MLFYWSDPPQLLIKFDAHTFSHGYSPLNVYSLVLFLMAMKAISNYYVLTVKRSYYDRMMMYQLAPFF